jgi:hypothetical protein
VVCRRVAESDLAELLALVHAYLEFNDVTRTDDQLLEISRALIADPDHEGTRRASGRLRHACLDVGDLGRRTDRDHG